MPNRKNIVVLTGAGISAESGLQTFRDSDGLWEGHKIEDVATPEAWARDPELVQHFYNIRRKSCSEAKPNLAHLALKELENFHDVHVITQNIDDLHERAGSTNILHLHGEIIKSQSSKKSTLVYDIIGDEIKMGETCALGSQLRPHVVWFGEAVPNLSLATSIVQQADILIIIGTSLQVYPAAGLIFETKTDCEIIAIDPNVDNLRLNKNIRTIQQKASIAVPNWVKSITE